MNPRRIRGVEQRVQEAARAMRHDQTTAEAALWEAVRCHRVAGLKFRRQQPMGRFVFDLVCASARLVVEIDGDHHDVQRDRDEARTAVLEAAGYRVIRFRNEEVLERLPEVVRKIAAASRTPTAPPLPELGEGWRL